MGREILFHPGVASHNYHEVTCENMSRGDVSNKLHALEYNSASVQVAGESAGAGVRILGRIAESAEFVNLEDSAGMPCNIRTDRICQISNLGVKELIAEVIGGNENTKLNVTILLKR